MINDDLFWTAEITQFAVTFDHGRDNVLEPSSEVTWRQFCTDLYTFSLFKVLYCPSVRLSVCLFFFPEHGVGPDTMVGWFGLRVDDRGPV